MTPLSRQRRRGDGVFPTHQSVGNEYICPLLDTMLYYLNRYMVKWFVKDNHQPPIIAIASVFFVTWVQMKGTIYAGIWCILSSATISLLYTMKQCSILLGYSARNSSSDLCDLYDEDLTSNGMMPLTEGSRKSISNFLMLVLCPFESVSSFFTLN